MEERERQPPQPGFTGNFQLHRRSEDHWTVRHEHFRNNMGMDVAYGLSKEQALSLRDELNDVCNRQREVLNT